jgi:hypothetical protein
VRGAKFSEARRRFNQGIPSSHRSCQISAKKNRCHSRTLDGQPCRRMVSIGQEFCFQHMHGLKARLHGISRSQSAAFYISVLSLVLGIWTTVNPQYPSLVRRSQSKFDAYKGSPVTYAQLESMRETQRWPTETLQTHDSVQVTVTRKNLPKTAQADRPTAIIK